MKQKKVLLLALFFCALVSVYPCDIVAHFEFEVRNSNDELLYWGCYDAVHFGPHIVEWLLTAERVQAQSVSRPNVSFAQTRDGGALLQALRAEGFDLPLHSDFTRSGYDRGHIAPNADFNDTTENATLTFFIANIWPQTPAFNRFPRGAWFLAEAATRALAEQHGAITVRVVVDEFTDFYINNKIRIPAAFRRYAYTLDGTRIFEVNLPHE